MENKVMENPTIGNKALAGFGIGLVTGVIMGGLIALLFAPKSGKDTQEMLRIKVMDTRDKAFGIADHVKGFATETANTVKEAVTEASRKGQAAVHAIES